jgi:hypothetical protein
MKCHKVSLSIVICLSGGIALNSLYRFIERIFPTGDDAFPGLRAILRYGLPFAWQALIGRILAIGRFIEEGSRRFLKSRMACTRARV